MNYKDKALHYAERYGIVTYELENNTIVYYETFVMENRIVKATVNLDTMQETRNTHKTLY